MLVKLRREYLQLVTSGAQLILLIFGLYFHSRYAWLFIFGLIVTISIPAWLSALKRLRAVRDTPTSKIASAAQGYVELAGRGMPFSDTPLLARFTTLPCVWYRYKVEERGSENKWQTVDSGESDDLFVLRDETGDCIVDPENAEIITKHHDQWYRGDRRYTQWMLIKNDFIYVIGQFRTDGGSTAEFDEHSEVGELLAEWKKDMPALHARFDLNGDGTLDMKEWMLARSAAKREVRKMIREAQVAPDTHMISRPTDGRLFLISNLEQNSLSRRYLLWTWAHLAIFFGALGSVGWLLQTTPLPFGLHK